MKAVSKTFKLQTLKLPQLPLGLPLQLDMLQGQIQGMFYGFGFMGQAAFGDFEGKAALKTILHMRWLPKLRRNVCVRLIDQLST